MYHCFLVCTYLSLLTFLMPTMSSLQSLSYHSFCQYWYPLLVVLLVCISPLPVFSSITCYTFLLCSQEHLIIYKDHNKSIMHWQVLARGHVVHTATVEKNLSGQSYVTLPSQLYAQVSPRMRIIAYYYSSGLSDFISDSLVVDTDHACLEEVW